MDEIRIKNIINKGEGLNVEFKLAQHTLPKSFFETVCAFLNHQGGTILLGVDDTGEIMGVHPEKAEQLCKEIASLSNNPTKLDPVFLIQPKVIEINNKKVVHTFVPVSSQVHKTNNTYYDRSSDGDFILKTHSKISELYNRKSTIFSENIIYPYLQEKDFEENTVQKAYQLIRAFRPNHPWLELSGIDFYKAAGLYRFDYNTNESGFTLASLLLFGKEETIASVLPYYKIEALLRIHDKERYDDRETIRCNLIRAYEELMKFITKHLPDNFYLESDHRISLRDNLFREIIANFLIHREYINPRVPYLEISDKYVLFKNTNKPHLYGSITPDNYESYPKNPHLAKFFVQIGRAEELGTGIKKIFKYSKLYSNKNPQIKEEDLFEVAIPIITPKTTPKTTPSEGDKLREIIIKLLIDEPFISASKIAKKINISRDGVRYHLQQLKDAKRITFVGKPRNGYWKVIEKS